MVGCGAYDGPSLSTRRMPALSWVTLLRRGPGPAVTEAWTPQWGGSSAAAPGAGCRQRHQRSSNVHDCVGLSSGIGARRGGMWLALNSVYREAEHETLHRPARPAWEAHLPPRRLQRAAIRR